VSWNTPSPATDGAIEGRGITWRNARPAGLTRALEADSQSLEAAQQGILVFGFRGILGGGLKRLLDRQAALFVVTLDQGDLFAAVGQHRPSVALIWHEALPGAIRLRRLILAHPETAIAVAVPDERAEGGDEFRLVGAVVLPLSMNEDDLCRALGLLSERIIGPPRLAGQDAAIGLNALTARELEVLEFLVQRRTTAEIAAALFVTEATVKAHTQHIFAKLGVRKRRDLALHLRELLGASVATPGHQC
jgi:DNA-binding NarL/FixJ family response regulator